MINQGTLLVSSVLLEDPNFQHTVILIAESNNKGHLGFVINQPFERTLNELVEFSESLPFPIYTGGPVDKEHLYFIHRRPDLIPGGNRIHEDLYLGGDFKQALLHINAKTIDSSSIKLFIGYCGWDEGELEAEMEEGSWVVAHSNRSVVFEEPFPPLTNLLD